MLCRVNNPYPGYDQFCISYKVLITSLLLLTLLLMLPAAKATTISLAQTSPLPACTLSVSPSTINWGKISPATFKKVGNELSLGKRSLTLNVICNQPTEMTFFYRAVAADNERFWFGNLGKYSLVVRDAKLDGALVELGDIPAVNQPPSNINMILPWQPERGLTAMKAGQIIKGNVFTMEIEITANTGKAALRTPDASYWDAFGVIELLPIGSNQEVHMHAETMPRSCRPSLSRSEVNFGDISAQRLKQNGNTFLDSRSVNLNVHCEDGATPFVLKIIDNRIDTASERAVTNFGLNRDNIGHSIGYFTIHIHTKTARVDAETAQGVVVIESVDQGLTWTTNSADSIPMKRNTHIGFTNTTHRAAGPMPVSDLNVELSVQAVIAPKETLNLTNVISLDGSVTIEIVY